MKDEILQTDLGTADATIVVGFSFILHPYVASGHSSFILQQAEGLR